MSLYVMHGGQMIKPDPTDFEVGKVYYYGGTVPASVIYITRIIKDNVYYLKLDDRLYHSAANLERRDSKRSLSAGVCTGVLNMQKEIKKYTLPPDNDYYNAIQRVLDNDASGFDIPTDIVTYETRQEQLCKKAAEVAKKPKPAYIGAVDVAKIVRKKLKGYFPGQKFSVKTDRYSMGSSIRVNWEDGPTTDQVKEKIGMYHGASFDGMVDLKSHHNTTDPDSGEVVHYANDYITPSRDYSKKAIIEIWRLTCEKWGIDPSYATLMGKDDHWYYNFNHERLFGGYQSARDYYYQIERETSFYTPVPQVKTPPKPATSGAVLGEYKGHKTITLPCGNKGFSFGITKAQAILEHLDAIQQFIDDNSECSE